MERILVAVYDILQCLDCGNIFDARVDDTQPVCECGNISPLETGKQKLVYRKTKEARP